MSRSGLLLGTLLLVALVVVIALVTLEGDDPSPASSGAASEPETSPGTGALDPPRPGVPEAQPSPVDVPRPQPPPVEPGPARVSGVVGKVVGPLGRPAGGVEVYATEPGLTAGLRGRLVLSQSDQEGAFLLLVSPGRHDVLALTPGMVPAVVPDVEVAEGVVSDIGVLRLEPGLEVRGRVVDTEGLPVKGALVHAFFEDDPSRAGDLPGRLGAAHWPRRAETDETGDFRVQGLGRDPVFLRAQRFDVVMEGPPPKVSPGATGIRIVVRRLRLVTGLVVSADDGIGVPGATVGMVLRTRRWGETQKFQTLVDGRFAFDLSGDRYRDPDLVIEEIRVSATGFVEAVRREPRIEDFAPETRASIALTRAAPVDPGRLRGRVTYDTGEPFRGELTLSFGKEGGAGRIFRVATDEEGAFLLEGVPPGEFALRTAPRSRRLLADTGMRLVIPPGGEETVAFTIERGGDLAVRVTDRGGAPIPGARIEWRSKSVEESGEAGAPEGTVRFLDLPPGTVEVSASAPGHRSERARVDVLKARETEVNLRLARD